MMSKSFLPLLLVLAISFEVALCIRDSFEVVKLDPVDHFTESSLHSPKFGSEKRLVPNGPNQQQPPMPPRSTGTFKTTNSYGEPTNEFIVLHDVPAGPNPINNNP
jgi:hypothetical protein